MQEIRLNQIHMENTWSKEWFVAFARVTNYNVNFAYI